MDNQPAANASSSSLVRLWPWLVVLLVLLFAGFIRFRLLDMPLERDEGEYAYAGQLILQGIPPYELAYNMKLPGTYYAYALGMAVFGETAAGVHLTLMVVNSLTIVFVFLLGRKLFGVTAGLVACASYGVLSVSPAVLGMAAHATQFVVVFAVPATLLLLRADEDRRAMVLFFSGLLYGLAFLLVQQGICFCLFGALFLIWRAVTDKTVFSKVFLKRLLVLGAGMVLPAVLFCFCCVIAGDFARFWFWTFVYAREYATGLSLTDGFHQLAKRLGASLNESLVLWIIAAAGPLVMYLDKSVRKAIPFVILFWCCSFLGVAFGLYFRPHYFVLLQPAFAVLLGATVTSSRRILQSAQAKGVLAGLPLVLFAAALGRNIFLQRSYFFQQPVLQVSQMIYGANPFIQSLQAAKYIRAHSSPDARVAVVGSEPQIYFYARRHSATGYIYTYALMEQQPYAVKMQHEMMQEIETAKPEFIVLVMCRASWLLDKDSDLTIFHWLNQYSKDFYETVGVIQLRPIGDSVSFWNDDARNYQGPVDQCLVIYKRKDGKN